MTFCRLVWYRIQFPCWWRWQNLRR